MALLARSPDLAGKTRLVSGLEPDTAAALRTALLLDTLDVALASGWPVRLFVTPSSATDALRARLAADPAIAPHLDRIHLHPQVEGDLGVRMGDAVARTLLAGHRVAVLVGADVPDLPVTALRAAGQAIAANPGMAALALGPASDGGFYLAATADAATLRTACAGLTWGHPDVLAGVQARAKAAGQKVQLVAAWHDVDTPDDLAGLCRRAAVTGRAPRTRQVAATLPAGLQ